MERFFKSKLGLLVYPLSLKVLLLRGLGIQSAIITAGKTPLIVEHDKTTIAAQDRAEEYVDALEELYNNVQD